MESIKKLLRTPSALALIIVAIITLTGVLVQSNSSKEIVQLTIDATSTAEAKLTERAPTITTTISSENKVIPIELLPATVYIYDVPVVESASSFNKLQIVTGNQSGITYKLIYPIPNSTNGDGAGIYFEFSPLLDISQYKSISFSLTKPDDDKVKLIMSGKGEHSTIPLSDIATNSEIGIQVDGDNYTISLERNFTNVKLVQFLFFWFSTSTTTEGKIEYKVSNIQFQKP